jgi:hypothetical protein
MLKEELNIQLHEKKFAIKRESKKHEIKEKL